MSISLLCLLLFALWTVGLILFVIGAYRISAILTGQRRIDAFPADKAHEGPGWYQRAIRAHLNCVENLPVFGAVVLVGALSGGASPLAELLAPVYLGARVLQTPTHICSISPAAITLRFTFFVLQLGCLLAMAWELFERAGGSA